MSYRLICWLLSILLDVIYRSKKVVYNLIPFERPEYPRGLFQVSFAKSPGTRSRGKTRKKDKHGVLIYFRVYRAATAERENPYES
jgi:hypothetical protein